MISLLLRGFNFFPSLQAAVSTICFYTWFRYSKLKPNFATKTAATAAFVIAAGVIISTLFIKQHYIADEIAGIALAYAIGKPLFNRKWKKSSKQNEATKNDIIGGKILTLRTIRLCKTTPPSHY